MADLNVGSRTHDRGTFFCSAKRKFPKKMPPPAAKDLALLACQARSAEGAPAPLPPRRIHTAPLRAIALQAAVLSAAAAGDFFFVTPERIAGIQVTWMYRRNHPWHLDSGIPCRNDEWGGCSCSSNPVQSRRAPELSTGSARRGDSGMNRGDRGAGAPSVAPRRKRGAQDRATVGPPFLWFVSFGGAKEMNSAVGPRTHIRISHRAAIQPPIRHQPKIAPPANRCNSSALNQPRISDNRRLARHHET
jgi:hypothetical protein